MVRGVIWSQALECLLAAIACNELGVQASAGQPGPWSTPGRAGDFDARENDSC